MGVSNATGALCLSRVSRRNRAGAASSRDLAGFSAAVADCAANSSASHAVDLSLASIEVLLAARIRSGGVHQQV